MRKVEKDFEELLRLFNAHKVKYCIIGAFAVGFHALPRYTKDMDILVGASDENARRIVEALKDFGFGELGLSVDDFNHKNGIIQLGYEPVRIDLFTSVEGVEFDKVWKERSRGTYGKTKVSFASLKDIIRMKKRSGRRQDKVDIELLKKRS